MGLFYGFFVATIIAILLFYYSKSLNTFEYISLLLTASFLFISTLSLIISRKQLSVSELQENAARESILAAKESILATNNQIIATVRPYIHFLIRPQSHLKDPGIQISRANWIPGVGIYVENIGSGPAIDYKISCKIIARDGSTRSCTKSFVGSRLLSGQRYSYPSDDWNEPGIKIDDEKIEIWTEYKDRLGNDHKQESIKIEIDRLFFADARASTKREG